MILMTSGSSMTNDQGNSQIDMYLEFVA